MTVRYKVGNIIEMIMEDIDRWDNSPVLSNEPKVSNYGHGANRCQTMGAGVAGQLAKHFSEVRKADTAVGDYTVAHLRPGVSVYNLYTQRYPGRCFELSMLATAVSSLEKEGVSAMTIPKIGAGIGGGDWTEIAELLEASPIDFCVVVLNENEIPEGGRR